MSARKNWLQRLVAAEPPASASVVYQPPSPEVMEKVLLTGDLAALLPSQRLSYYESVCRALKLNPLTKPFEYITLNGKLTLYARKDCTDQLRRTYGISLFILAREVVDQVLTVTAKAQMPNGREDQSLGAVFLPTPGPDRANAIMKCETKAKRRVTLSICGLGMFDESEMDGLPDNGNDAERRVKEAHANRLTREADINFEVVSPVTQENFNDIICHIGKAEGNMLGKTIRDIHPSILQWLKDHFGEGEGIRWGNPPTSKDERLKEAVDIALEKLSSS